MPLALLTLVGFLVTAWLFARFVDWCYRVGLGEPDPEPAPEAEPRSGVLTSP
jgi:hypothetical protein